MTTLRTALLTLTILAFATTMLFAQKKTITIVKTISVETTPANTYAVLSQLELYPNWSPFLLTDPEQKNHVTGENGALNSAFHWEGVAEKSKGYQTLIALEADHYLKFECTIEKPTKAKAFFEYEVQADEDGTSITQTFTVPTSAFGRFMMKLFGVEKEMATTNQLGLERLKAYLESGEVLANIGH